MMGNETAGLVGRVTEMLAAMPDALIALTQESAPTATERRARLALRIALMRRGDIVIPVQIDMTPLRQPDPPAAIDLPPPPAPVPPRAKPARVSMSTLGLEQAALLLAAAAAPEEPETSHQPAVNPSPLIAEPVAPEPELAVFEAVAPKMKKSGRATGGLKDMGDAFAALAALGDADGEVSGSATPVTEAVLAEEPQSAKTEPAPTKTRRRSGAISAADGLANAAAALASMQAADPEETPVAKPVSAQAAAMAAGFAAFDAAED